MEIVDCPNCNAQLEVDEDLAEFDCPNCGTNLSFEEEEEQPKPGGKKKFSPGKRKTPPKRRSAAAGGAKRPPARSRKQFLDELRGNSAYQSLRTLVGIYFWTLAIVVSLGWLGFGFLGAAAAKEQESSAGMFIFGGAMLGLIATLLVMHAVYQFYQAYVDIADASIEQAYKAQ